MSRRPTKTATPRRGARSFRELLAAYPASVQALARASKALILDVLPQADETVDNAGPYVGYGYGPGYKGLVATIIVSQTGVKIGVAHGARLPDPEGLLAGAGKVHRHIALREPADLGRPTVRRLLELAREHRNAPTARSRVLGGRTRRSPQP